MGCDWSSIQIGPVQGGSVSCSLDTETNDKVYCVNQFVDQEDSPDKILSKTPCPIDLDMLVIDIDGNDYWIWKWLDKYITRVLMIEFNSSMPSNLHFVQQYDPNVFIGSSLRALVSLGKEKGYELVCVLGGNAIFVHESEFPKMNIEDNSIETLFCSLFTPMLVSDQNGVHYILRVGAYGMSKEAPQNPLYNFQLVVGTPKSTHEIFIEPSTDEKNLSAIFRRGWVEKSKDITPIQIETFAAVYPKS